jgi:hypothetical protein
MIDSHGAPGAHVAMNSDTRRVWLQLISKRGFTMLTEDLHFAVSPGFYVDYKYERANELLKSTTHFIRINKSYRKVCKLEVFNES